MTRRTLDRAAWAGSCILVATAIAGLYRPPLETTPAVAGASARRVLAAPPAESIAAWATRGAARNPFRFERRPASRRFGEVVEVPAAAERPARPVLSLHGTSGGPPWQGVVAGIPGLQRPVVVRAGDRVAGFVIKSVGPDRLVVEGMDSVWNLSTRRVQP